MFRRSKSHNHVGGNYNGWTTSARNESERGVGRTPQSVLIVLMKQRASVSRPKDWRSRFKTPVLPHPRRSSHTKMSPATHTPESGPTAPWCINHMIIKAVGHGSWQWLHNPLLVILNVQDLNERGMLQSIWIVRKNGVPNVCTCSSHLERKARVFWDCMNDMSSRKYHYFHRLLL